MIQPYANDRQSQQIGKLTLENQQDRVVLYGQMELTRDQVGLHQARELLQILQAVVSTLEAEAALPEQLPPATINMQRRNVSTLRFQCPRDPEHTITYTPDNHSNHDV